MKKKIYIVVLVISIGAYLSIFVPPDLFWIAGFITYFIPFVLLFNIFLFLRDAKNLKLSFLLPLGILICGWGFINATFQFPLKHETGELRVLSYNTRVFNIYDPKIQKEMSPVMMTDWIRNTKADLICLQEFYTETAPGGINTVKMINRENVYQVVNIPVMTNRINAQFGAAIFSRFPVIRSGKIKFEGNTQNQAIFADILIKNDTVRVYNLHLQSMHIHEKEFSEYQDHLQDEVTDIYSRLKKGFIQRSLQIKMVKAHIKSCSYRIIVCGDLNDLPYSYSYHQLKQILTNTFAKEGTGFGFTYNGKLPFLRIDNQFYSDGIKAYSLKTFRKVTYSDHFPVLGTYSLVDR